MALHNLLGALALEATQVSVLARLTVGATSLSKAEDAAHAGGDAGVQVLGVRNDNAATAPTSANGDYGYLAIDANGAVFVRDRPLGAATVARVASSASSVTLLAAAATTRRVLIQNDSTAVLRVKLGAAASATSFTRKLGAGEFWEVPEGYNGIIDGIWESADGAAQVTALV